MNKKSKVAILVFCCLINLCVGALYAWSVFATPLETHLNSILDDSLEAGMISMVFTVSMAVGPITMILGGRINDKIGPKWVLLVGGLMFGGGMIITSFATSFAMVVIGYGILGGLSGGMVYSCNVSTAIKCFPEKRGLVGGVTTASYGISSVIISKTAGIMIAEKGISWTFLTLGVIFLLVICVGSFVVGSGVKKDKICSNTGTKKLGNDPEKDKDWKQMLTSGRFYLMVVILMCGAVCGMMCISQAAVIATNMMGFTVTAAATVVAVLALFNAGGRVIAGYLSDKIGRPSTLLLSSALSIAGLVLLYVCGAEDTALFYTGISLVGIYFGTFMGVFPGFTTDAFGLAHNSVNYGIMFIGFAAAGFIGPAIIGNIYLLFGSYDNAFILAAGFSLFGAALIALYKRIFEKDAH
ncbi:MAG: OFA family MFS transporter [Bacillota bacterium]|nr:OFA family MFS transporter [Bacillota bacterium]